MATTFSSGNITLAGFSNADTQAGSFSSGYGGATFAGNFNGAPVDDYLFNWTGADAFGNGSGQVISSSNATSDAWSLSVSLISYGGSSTGVEQLFTGSTFIETIDGSHAAFTGTGDADLVTFMKTLNVQNSAGEADSFAIQFTLTDGLSTTQLTEYFAACYLAGTRIAVPAGEVAIETLRAGDLVMTANGVAKPIKWIGRRSYTAAQVAANAQLRPVTIRQDALAAGMPHRDLSVSSMHALFVDDVFVPAAALVNGVSVLRSDELAPAMFLHIELEDHDVIFAEGAPAETYVDDNSRLMFDNADEYYDAFGATPAKTFSATRLEDGYQLEAIRTRLAARAGAVVTPKAPGPVAGHVERIENGVLQGWVVDLSNPSVPVELDVLVDGETVARVIANRYRFDLDRAGFAGGRCGFTLAVPAAAASLDQVQVRRVADGLSLAISKATALVG